MGTMGTYEASTILQFQLRQFEVVTDYLYYATIEEANAIQEFARQEGKEYEQCLCDLYIRGAVDTALHHYLYGEALMDAPGPNPQEVDEWIAVGWAIIEARLDAIDILDNMAGCSVKVVETPDAKFETTLSNELGQETIITVADPCEIPALYAHLLHGIHPWAEHLITGSQ